MGKPASARGVLSVISQVGEWVLASEWEESPFQAGLHFGDRFSSAEELYGVCL